MEDAELTKAPASLLQGWCQVLACVSGYLIVISSVSTRRRSKNLPALNVFDTQVFAGN